MPTFASTIVVTALVALAAQAAPPTPAEEARALHDQAVEASRTGDWDTAVERWQEAERLDPHWKYSFNLASTYAHQEQWMPAWDAARRTRAAGLPEQHLPPLEKIESAIRMALQETHAWVELTVIPADAVVERDGAVWTERQGWIAAASSRLAVRREGYLPVEQAWPHPVGERSVATIRLAPVPVAEPTPEPESQAEVVAPPEPVVSLRTGRPIPAWKWGLIGAGAAIAAGGGGLLGWAGSVAADARSLEETSQGFSDYEARYDELSATHRQIRISGAVLVGVGAAAAITGLVLALIDDDESEPAVTVSPASLGDGGLAARVRF